MKLEYSDRAYKDFRKIPKGKTKSIVKKIELLSESPYFGKKLGGKFTGFYSLPVWPYRVIYQVIKRQRIVMIVAVEHRQGAYK
ncbi:MAG: type II toxin-antitoxin system RelE/ParE family toxin [Candidatus Beckwithbacteria bacterium]